MTDATISSVIRFESLLFLLCVCGVDVGEAQQFVWSVSAANTLLQTFGLPPLPFGEEDDRCY